MGEEELTVLDLQMHNVAVDRAIRHYWEKRWDEVRSLDDLEQVLARNPDDLAGNRAAAQYLWGNNYWNRIRWLRGFVKWLGDTNLKDQETLRKWAQDSEFERDFRGRVKYLGIAAYSWLQMRLGVDTVKPDTHLHAFAERALGRRLGDEELIIGFIEVAKRLGRPARQLDWAIWELQRGAPGTV